MMTIFSVFLCVFFEAENQGLNSPNDYVVKLIFVWSCNIIFNKVLSWRTKRAVVISFSCESSCPSGPCMSPFCPPPLPPPALPVHEPSYGHHLHSTCKGSRKVQLFFLLSLTTLIFRQIPGYKWSNSVFWETKEYCQRGILFEQPDCNFWIVQ